MKVTRSTRTTRVPLSLGSTEVTLTATGDVTERPAFNQVLDEAFGLWILNVTWALSSLGTKTGTRGEEHLSRTPVRIDLNFGDSTYSFVIIVDTDMQGVAQTDVAKLLAHMPCKAATIVEYINTRTATQPDPFISKVAAGLSHLFDSTPFDGIKKPTAFDLGSIFGDAGKPTIVDLGKIFGSTPDSGIGPIGFDVIDVSGLFGSIPRGGTEKPTGFSLIDYLVDFMPGRSTSTGDERDHLG